MKLLLLIAFVLFSSSVLSQNSFRIEWEVEDNTQPTRGIVDSEGNTVIVGLIRKPQNNNDIDAFIFKMTPNGNYSQVRTPAPADTSFYYQNIIQLDNGNYFTLGRKGPTDYYGTDTQNKIIINIFDNNLNLLIDKSYDYNETYKNIGYAVFQKEETGNIILAASVTRKTGSSTNITDLGLLRFTPTGDTTETRFYHYDRNVNVYDFEKIPESDNFMILEWKTQIYGDFECYILKPDLTAECINYHSSFDYSIDQEMTCDYWYPDGSFMMASGLSLSDNSSDRGLGVFKCDTLANISDYLFLNKTDTFDAQAYSQCMAFSDVNSIYITGYIWDYFNCPNPDSIELYVIDTELNQVAYKSLGGDMSYDVFGVLTAKDGGAIIYGKALNPDNNCNNNLVVFYVSREELGLPPVKVYDIEKNEDNALVYPNPASDIINIRIKKELLRKQSRIKLYNSNGKKIYDYRLPQTGNTLQLNIRNLKSGIYIYEITNDNEVISKGKFIKN